MARRRKARIPDKVKLAAALLTIVRPDESGALVPVISYEEAKRMTAQQIISRFRFDHGVHETIGGPTVPWNITPRPIAEDHVKTYTKDIPQIAKTKRLAKAQVEHEGVMLTKVGLATLDGSQAPERPRRPSRKLQGRGFAKGKSRALKSAGFRKPERPAKIPRFKA